MLYFLFIMTKLSFALTGQEVIDMVKKSYEGYGRESTEMTLILSEDGKVIAERKMKAKNLEQNSEVTQKSLIEFTHPNDVKGTKLLSWLYKAENKAQWVYLPALKKAKRILAGNQNSSFMGSEFTYEDIGGQDTHKYNYQLLNEKKEAKDLIWVVEQKAKDTTVTDYQVLHIKKSVMSPILIEYFNGKKEKIRESMIDDFQTYQVGSLKLNRPSRISMKNLITKKESTFRFDKREFGGNIKEADFAAQALDRN